MDNENSYDISGAGEHRMSQTSLAGEPDGTNKANAKPTGEPAGGEGGDQTPAGDPAETGGGEEGTPPKESGDGGEDYKVKFAESTRENQRIMDENKSLQASRAEDGARIAELERTNAELEALAKKENPEGYNGFKLKSDNDALRRDVAEMKENQSLDSFIGRTPGAENYRDALRNLGRSAPGKSYEAIWQETFAEVARMTAAADTNKTSQQKKTAADTGKGTSTRDTSAETIGGLPIEQFNALPLSKRRDILRKQGL